MILLLIAIPIALFATFLRTNNYDNTIAHEQVHVDQFKDEIKNPGTGLDYNVGAGKVMFKGKEYDYSVMQAGKGPWEKPAYAAEKK